MLLRWTWKRGLSRARRKSLMGRRSASEVRPKTSSVSQRYTSWSGPGRGKKTPPRTGDHGPSSQEHVHAIRNICCPRGGSAGRVRGEVRQGVFVHLSAPTSPGPTPALKVGERRNETAGMAQMFGGPATTASAGCRAEGGGGVPLKQYPTAGTAYRAFPQYIFINLRDSSDILLLLYKAIQFNSMGARFTSRGLAGLAGFAGRTYSDFGVETPWRAGLGELIAEGRCSSPGNADCCGPRLRLG